jgi:hypothetical protein
MDELLPVDQVTPVTRRTAYLCPLCLKPGAVDPGFTQIDDRYATGTCTGEHEGKRPLIREDVAFSHKKPKSRKPKRK